MIKGLDHIGIAVADLDAALKLWQTVTGATVEHHETIASQGIELIALRIGDLKIELLHPLSPDSPVAKFLATRGEGIHHLAVTCESAQVELDRVRNKGAQLIDEVQRTGAEGSHIGFVHPRSLAGVLLEFVDHGGQT